MSDEKIDALDRRVTELLTMTGSLVETVTVMAKQQELFAEEQKKFAEEQKRHAEEQKGFAAEQKRLAEEQKGFATEQKITSGRLEDVFRVVIEQKKEQAEFRLETAENFAILREENKVINRKVEWATTIALDADKRVEALEQRVAKLEEKFAA